MQGAINGFLVMAVIGLLVVVMIQYAVAREAHKRRAAEPKRKWRRTGTTRWDEIERFEVTGYVREVLKHEELDLYSGDRRWVTDTPFVSPAWEHAGDYEKARSWGDKTRLRRLDGDTEEEGEES